MFLSQTLLLAYMTIKLIKVKKRYSTKENTHTHTQAKKKAKTNKQTMQKQGIRTNARKTPLSVTHGDEWKISEQDQSWVMVFHVKHQNPNPFIYKIIVLYKLYHKANVPSFFIGNWNGLIDT